MQSRSAVKESIYTLANPVLCPSHILTALIEDPMITVPELLFVKKKCATVPIRDLLVVLNRLHLLTLAPSASDVESDSIEDDADEDGDLEENFEVVEKQQENGSSSFRTYSREAEQLICCKPRAKLVTFYEVAKNHPLFQTPALLLHKSSKSRKDLNLQSSNVKVDLRRLPVSIYNLHQMQRIVGVPHFLHKPFQRFRTLFRDSPTSQTLNSLGKKFQSWRLTKKHPFDPFCEEPRIKKYLFDQLQVTLRQRIDFADHGPYVYDRLEEPCLDFFKKQGFIDKRFIYDHPYWFSREDTNFFVDSLSGKRLRDYMSWRKNLVRVNAFDREPRMWDGHINRRLFTYELLQAKANEEIHPQFEYDNVYWMENWQYSL
jgi:hypothetical protein